MTHRRTRLPHESLAGDPNFRWSRPAFRSRLRIDQLTWTMFRIYFSELTAGGAALPSSIDASWFIPTAHALPSSSAPFPSPSRGGRERDTRVRTRPTSRILPHWRTQNRASGHFARTFAIPPFYYVEFLEGCSTDEFLTCDHKHSANCVILRLVSVRLRAGTLAAHLRNIVGRERHRTSNQHIGKGVRL